MITIYANNTCDALATGTSLADARAKLTDTHCLPDAEFGTGPADLTALDTGPHPIDHTGDGFAYLFNARKFFPDLHATGRARVADPDPHTTEPMRVARRATP